ncbi:PIN domain-containing protein [Enemella dayhoffiae]|uniref:PIN domain-containing protein n=1 Tax=Enemella dayhoffiae TaxID=2016507 RepID=UPI001E5FA27F|nr:PIN domain-containing protein [Enemella dayhoffiae]
MIVLDTNVISEIFRPTPERRVVQWLESLRGDVAITAITLAELLAGVRELPGGRRKAALVSRIDEAIEPYRGSSSVLSFDEAAADRYADVLVAGSRRSADQHCRWPDRCDLSGPRRDLRDAEHQEFHTYGN